MKKPLQLILKLLIAALILWLLLSKAEGEKVWANLRAFSAPVLFLCLSLALAAGAIVAGRTRFLLSTIGIALPRFYSFRLYCVGMLFNLVLPTGVGGDAVKAWALRKQYGAPLASLVKILILDRASGLFVLCLIALLIFALLPTPAPLAGLAWLGLPVVTVSYFYLARRFFGQRPRDGVQAFWYSVASQGLWCLSIAMLCGFGEHAAILAYVMLYAAASVVSMLPVTIGGLGLREMTFYFGAQWLNHHAQMTLDPERAVAVSLAFFAVYVVSALPGLLWMGGLWRKEGSINNGLAP